MIVFRFCLSIIWSILINYVKLQLLDPARVHGHSSSGNAYADFLSRASYSPRGSASTRGAPISMTISQAIEGSCGYSGDSPSTQVVILEVYLGLAWATGACVFGCIVVQVGGCPSQRVISWIMDIEYTRLMLMVRCAIQLSNSIVSNHQVPIFSCSTVEIVAWDDNIFVRWGFCWNATEL